MAAEQPLLLVTEVEPQEINSFEIGSSVRLHLSIVDAEKRLPVDPDVLQLIVAPPYQSPTTYTYGIGTEIVKSSTGAYYADTSFTVSGKWNLQYIAILSSVSVGSNTSLFYVVNSRYW